MDNQPHGSNVFLAHNSADKPTVEELARRLVQAGLSPFLDIRHLISCEPIPEATKEARPNGWWIRCAETTGSWP